MHMLLNTSDRNTRVICQEACTTSSQNASFWAPKGKLESRWTAQAKSHNGVPMSWLRDWRGPDVESDWRNPMTQSKASHHLSGEFFPQKLTCLLTESNQKRTASTAQPFKTYMCCFRGLSMMAQSIHQALYQMLYALIVWLPDGQQHFSWHIETYTPHRFRKHSRHVHRKTMRRPFAGQPIHTILSCLFSLGSSTLLWTFLTDAIRMKSVSNLFHYAQLARLSVHWMCSFPPKPSAVACSWIHVHGP